MTRKSLLVPASLAFLVSLAPGPARAADLGGQFGMGLGLAAGNTHRQVDGASGSAEGGGGGLGLDLAGRLWAGPVVLGGTATMLTTLIGPSEQVLTGGAGFKLELGETGRLFGLLEGGRHRVSGLGRGLFTHAIEGGSASSLCGVARLAFVTRRRPRAPATLGVGMFLLTDLRTQEVDTVVGGFVGGSSSEQHQTGGTMGGVTFHLTVGS